MRADVVLLVALAFAGGATGAVAWLPAVSALAGVLVVCRRSLRPLGLCCICAAFLAGWLRADRELAHYQASWVRARDELGSPKRCAALATVTSSPVWRDGELGLYGELSEVECEGARVTGPVPVRFSAPVTPLGRGDQLRLIGDFGVVELRHQAELPSPWPRAARSDAVASGVAFDTELVQRAWGIRRWIDAARAAVRERIRATFAPDAEPLARALVLGEANLSEDDEQAFRRAGLLHLLAVSGTHLVFAVVAAVRALSFVLVRVEVLAARMDVSRISSALGVPLSLLYADFAGGSGSAWRAAFMLCAVLSTKALGERPSASRSMAAAMFIGALFDPLAVFDVSFMLSAAATAGLLWLGPLLTSRVRRLPSRVARFVAESIAATVSSMLPCAPLLALLGPELTVVGLFANLLAAPFGEFVSLPLCLLHTLLAPFPALERGVALVASGALISVRQIAHEAAAVPGLSFDVPPPASFHFVVLVVGGAGLLAALQKAREVSPPERRVRLAAWCASLVLGLWLVESACVRAGRPQGQLRLSVLDIGQGDSALLDFPSGQLWLVDGGGIVGKGPDPGERVVLPVLRARRRTALDVVVLSHPHPDHFMGLLRVLEQVPVRELWDTGQGQREGAGPAYRELLETARRRGVRIRRPEELCGARRVGEVKVLVFAPCPAFIEGRGANDNSFVIRLSFGQRSFLLTGDSEHEQEQELVKRFGAELRADVLKVGHHGSRSSSSEALLRAVQPRWATISTGLRNRFGHPHQEALERLSQARVVALRTDRLGSLSIATDGASLSLLTATRAR